MVRASTSTSLSVARLRLTKGSKFLTVTTPGTSTARPTPSMVTSTRAAVSLNQRLLTASILEFVAYAVDGLDALGTACILSDFLAKVLDVDIDGPLVSVISVSLDRFQQLRAGERPSRILHHGGQQIELGGGQLHWLARDFHRGARQIDGDLARGGPVAV